MVVAVAEGNRGQPHDRPVLRHSLRDSVMAIGAFSPCGLWPALILRTVEPRSEQPPGSIRKAPSSGRRPDTVRRGEGMLRDDTLPAKVATTLRQESHMLSRLSKLLFLVTLLSVGASAQGPPEVVARFHGPMPTGVTVSREGRIFVCFPRWGDPVRHTVAEIRSGSEVPYPSQAYATYDPARPGETLVSVQSVVVDSADRLWLLDTGSRMFSPPIPGGAKLVGIDLKTNKVFKTITFPPDVALETTYLNDVR